MAEDPDIGLIRALQAGKHRALDELMARHQEGLFRFAFRYTGNETAARDVVQETFVRVYFKVASYSPRAAVKTWIYAIAVNLCRDALRHARRTRGERSLDLPPAERAVSEPVDPTATPDESAAAQDRFVRLQAAITRLPSKLREALVLCALDGRPQKEAAEILGTTQKTVELRVRHAKDRLRALLRIDERFH